MIVQFIPLIAGSLNLLCSGIAAGAAVIVAGGDINAGIIAGVAAMVNHVRGNPVRQPTAKARKTDRPIAP